MAHKKHLGSKCFAKIAHCKCKAKQKLIFLAQKF